MENVYERALKAHEEWKGKVGIKAKAEIKNLDDLSLAYSPGVAEPCRKIHENVDDAYKYTWKGKTVAVVSDGTAVLGLGDIGPEAALPVMEGKSALFKNFGDVDAVPIVLDTKDPDEIIAVVKALAPTFGGINLEDISAPRCVEIERKLIEELDIPVFHDDQHGTAIVVLAGLINAFKLLKKDPKECTVVVSGAGAAGSSIIKLIKQYGIKNVYTFDSKGIICSKNKDRYNFVKKEILEMTNNDDEDLTMAEAMAKADVFLGVSTAGIIDEDMVKSMKENSIVFAMANPEPEIDYDLARKAGAKVVGTGRSDYPNQINNVLAFPGIFKGALAVRATKITDEMKLAAAMGIASMIPDDEITDEHIIPSAFDEGVADAVAKAVADKAKEQNLIR
ncbi:NAD(P)-dependent malic enzyme [Peptoniphilus stercorisuis]|uniref:Malate dehydrogenase (Oxaloacetate-decarboxylating) n=1 Tax=Peptoniphilus stercorisuis TaxID=1436965 RepID=A0ABS4KAL0_9FIRM|nr:NADP-dependent malic enzyme [Peptoniphilus stercorisuis]MBP2024809.1 malate dehydrogenase (oxaloacetate-decarboxylating) [Peptoniphilus stercorisuis]